MKGLNLIQTWTFVIRNENSWVLFEGGTVVIFLPGEIQPGMNIKTEAINRLKAFKIRDLAVAELVGNGLGWIVNCGDDYILSYMPQSPYKSRYDRLLDFITEQKQDQQDLKIIHIEKKG